MNLLKKLKNIFIKPIQVNSTTLSKINTDLIKVPNFNDLSDNDKEKVLEYIKEIDISNLESVIKYASDLNEKANANVEILMRLYYRLVDEKELKLNTGNIIYDKYNTLININELNLCKNELLNLRKDGILRVVALEEVLKKENLRKLFFSSIFGKYERLKRKTELNSLIDSIERTKVVIKVIEQLIQTVNINVSNELLKVSAENTLFSITKEDASTIIGNIINETKSLINTFLPEYENKFTFNINNINECIVELSVAKRLLDLYAYKHKDEASSIIEDIENIYFMDDFKDINFKQNITKQISIIENKYKLFENYLKGNPTIKESLTKLYTLKFKLLTHDLENQEQSPFIEIYNEKELKYYENIISSEIEKILKGDIIIFNAPNLKFSNEKKKMIITVIKEMLMNKIKNLSPDIILMYIDALLLIKAFSRTFYNEKEIRIALLNNYHTTLPRPIITSFYDRNFLKYKRCTNIFKFLINFSYLYYEYPYNNNELTEFDFPKIIHDRYHPSSSDLTKLEFFMDAIKASKTCILTEDPTLIQLSPKTNANLNNLKIETLVLSPDTQYIEDSFNNCKHLQVVDASFINPKVIVKIKDSFNNCPNLKYLIVTREQLNDNCITNEIIKEFNFKTKSDAVLIVKAEKTYYLNINNILNLGIDTKNISLYILKHYLKNARQNYLLTHEEYLSYLKYKNTNYDNKYSIGIDWKNNENFYIHLYNKMYKKKI